jgi:HNH endonuclease
MMGFWGVPMYPCTHVHTPCAPMPGCPSFMPSGPPPKKTKKDVGKMQGVELLVQQATNEEQRATRLLGVHGYMDYADGSGPYPGEHGYHNRANRSRRDTWASEGEGTLPHTYSMHGHPPPRLHRRRLPPAWAPALKYGADKQKDAVGRWGQVNNTTMQPVAPTHRVSYGLPWACMVEPGLNDHAVLQRADAYLAGALLDPTFSGNLMAGPPTTRARVLLVLQRLHDVVLTMHKAMYQGEHAHPDYPGIYAFTHPPQQDGRSLCVDYDPHMVVAMGYNKWMTCSRGWLYLKLGTVRSANGKLHNVCVNAHRFLIFAMLGDADGGLSNKVVMHTCNNKRCLNPCHLLVGTESEHAREDYTHARALREAWLARGDVGA